MSEAHDRLQVPPAMPPLSPFLRTFGRCTLEMAVVPEMLGFAVFPHRRVISQRPYCSQKPSNTTAHHREVMSPASSTQPASTAHLQVCPSSAGKATAWYSALAQGEDRQVQPSVPSVARPLRSSPKCALCLCRGTGSFS